MAGTGELKLSAIRPTVEHPKIWAVISVCRGLSLLVLSLSKRRNQVAGGFLISTGSIIETGVGSIIETRPLANDFRVGKQPFAFSDSGNGFVNRLAGFSRAPNRTVRLDLQEREAAWS